MNRSMTWIFSAERIETRDKHGLEVPHMAQDAVLPFKYRQGQLVRRLLERPCCRDKGIFTVLPNPDRASAT